MKVLTLSGLLLLLVNLNILKLFRLKLLLLFVLLTTIVNGQIDFTSIKYRGIRPDDRSGLLPIRNPGRGLRIEDTLDLSNKQRKVLDSTSFLKRELMKHASDSIAVVHTALYFSDYVMIADSDLERMQIYFDTLRGMGLKSVLRLGYKKGQNQTVLVFHSDRLKQFIDRNKDVVLDIEEGLTDAWSPGKGGALSDGYKVAVNLMLHQANSFGLSVDNSKGGNEKKYAMENWRNVPVGPEDLMTYKLPFSEDYFKSSTGNIVQRPLYDYIRDHLGYRLELQQLMLPVKRPDNSPIVLKLELINRGFSAVKHLCTMAFVLIDPTGKVYELPAEGDPGTWQPFATGDVNFKPVSYFIQYHGKLPLHLIPGKYKLGLWIADANASTRYDCRYDIRCANGNTGWYVSIDGRYGVNVLTSLTISK
jgi:hypothetical protein